VCYEGYTASKVAVLSEDETAFGAGNPADLSTDSDKKVQDKEVCPDTASTTALHLYFPRDISALRNAYQQDSKVSAASGNAAAPRSNLTLNLEDHGNNDDSVASYAPSQTPLSDEAIMMGIVSDLRERRTKVVVIEATNPLDTVFLVRYLRQAYSNAWILTVGSDLLLPRQVDDPRLRGVMQVTSYSLIPEIDRYTTSGFCGQSSNLNRIFPSDYSVGTFNALLSLIEGQGSALHPLHSCPQRDSKLAAAPGEMDSVGQPVDLPIAGYVQYGWPTLAGDASPQKSLLVPPLWLTMLGRDQFWPIELLDGADTKPEENQTSSILHAIILKPQSDNHRPDLQPTWTGLCALGAAFALAYALLAWNGNIVSASAFVANFAPVEDACRNLTLLVSGIIFFDVLVCLWWPQFWFPSRATWYVLALFVTICMMILYDLWRRSGWLLAILSLLLGRESYVILRSAFDAGPGPLHNFMKYRYAHVTSGLSPVVPFLLLFIGCLWVCWYSLSGRPPWDLDGTGPELPEHQNAILETKYNAESPVDRQRLFALTKLGNIHLLNAMNPGKFNWRILAPASITLLIIVLVGIAPASPHHIQSFESPGYDSIYTYFVISTLLVLLMDVFRLVIIWLELRNLLMVLDRLPIRRGFARMAGFNLKRLWQLGGSTFEDYFAILSKEIQTVTALINSRPPGSSVPGELEGIRVAVHEFAAWIQDIPKDDMKKVPRTKDLCDGLRGLQVKLAGTCAVILQELNQEWNSEKRPVWEAECIVQEKSQCKDQSLPHIVRLREDFVCLFFVNFISSVFTRMRSLVLSIAGFYVFILLSFGSYPFEPDSSFHTAMVFLLILIVVVVGIVYGQAHKDATLSRITETKPGELGTEFWFRMAGVIAVPLLTLVATRFPEFSGFLFSWLAPASQAFR
jgi:hypothetical protein